MNLCIEYYVLICVYIWGIFVELVYKFNSLYCLDVINVIIGWNLFCEIYQNIMGMFILYVRNSRFNFIVNKVGKFNLFIVEGGRVVS